MNAASAMSWNDRLLFRQQNYQDLVVKEHHRVINNCDKTECNIRVICEDGVIHYTKLLFFFMQPDLRSVLNDYKNEPLVIFYPSLCIQDIIQFYELDISDDPPSVMEEPSTNEDRDTNFSYLPPLRETSNPSCESIPEPETIGSDSESWFCEKCGVAYKTLKQLKKHQYNQHKQGIHKCTQCLRQFTHKFELTQHMFKHMPPTFICNSCGKAFKRKHELLVHYKMFHDSTITIFKCPECPLTFRTESNMRRHKAIHSGQKQKFKCSYCDSSFSRKDNYNRHQKLHG